MKKAIMIAMCMLLVPAVAMAMQPISESQMDSVTGQSGVSIVLDDIQIYQHTTGQETWYEDTSDNGASVGFVYDEDESYTMIYVNALTGYDVAASDGDYFTSPGSVTATKGTYVADYFDSNSDFSFSANPMTIDVSDSLTASSSIADATDVAGVRIGLPTVEIYFAEGSSDVMNIAVSTADNPIGSLDSGWSFGKLHQSPGGSTIAVLDGYVEISPNDAWQ